MAFDLNNLQNKLAGKDITAAIIGLGYVGLPLAQAMLTQGLHVIGLDIDPAKIEMLAKGEVYIDSVDPQKIAAALKDQKFEPSSDFATLTKADFIVVCVPTPLKDNNEPDLSYVEQTMHNIAAHLKPDQVVILESTTYPGTMRDVVIPLLEKESALTHGKDFHAAYSPEREDPGNQNFNTDSIPKIIGAGSSDALTLTQSFYEIFIKDVVPVSSMEVAEAAKITENIFRAVNIAFVNELKMIFDPMGIDVWEVIDAAKTKPFGYMPFYPGPGIGGHCIPIDPFYLSWKAAQSGQATKFIELAGEINLSMSDYIIGKLKPALGKPIKNSKLLIIGVAYKKNVADQRETPAFPLMKKLMDDGAAIDFHDPHIENILPARQYPEFAGKESVTLSADTLPAYDAVLIITDHDDIDYNLIAGHSRMIVDTRNALRGRDIIASGEVVLA